MRRLLSDLLGSSPEIEIVGTARDGREAVLQAARLKPDVITLDVEMPEVSGLEALPAILAVHPVPVVMVSALTKEGADVTLQALELGRSISWPSPSGTNSRKCAPAATCWLERCWPPRKAGFVDRDVLAPYRAVRHPGRLSQPRAQFHGRRPGPPVLQRLRHPRQFPAHCVSSSASPRADRRRSARYFRFWLRRCRRSWSFSTCRRSSRASSPNDSIATAPC